MSIYHLYIFLVLLFLIFSTSYLLFKFFFARCPKCGHRLKPKYEDVNYLSSFGNRDKNTIVLGRFFFICSHCKEKERE